MPLQDDLSAIQRNLDDLVRGLASVEPQVGHTLDMRRVRTDADHLRESLALLRETTRGAAGSGRQDIVQVPDAPYDRSLWGDAEEEGLGARDRHAP
ncbi:hypothetical protein K7472_04555 [Streptomyces sp. PTM05]|uniref:Uncharacterized protein n=1 Tax=Streptantibioticus parmotrematis TaxID=2873249 RepID=A0ABS7QMX9_9ACTN|nr:hypothetical protein [Streptantibioticus parmotrematis]MBY8884116.1 hypothetical protein [Streptantibioticus parmotrematis]